MNHRFIGLTKGRVLEALRAVERSFDVPQLIIVERGEWFKRRNLVCEQIQLSFGRGSVAVRSSGKNEDTQSFSNAGAYDSQLDVNCGDRDELCAAIDKVFRSYGASGDDDEVIIQEMVSNVTMAGVVFTREVRHQSAYYAVNYDDISGKTDSVTSGTDGFGNKTLYILRGHEESVVSGRFKKLIDCVLELENLFETDRLDIEFAVSQDLTVKILQVRPLVLTKSTRLSSDAKLVNAIHSSVSDFRSFFNGEVRLLGQMPDWNPAEMIGTVATPLAASMYETLITNRVWATSREKLGYQMLEDKRLMYMFAGHPYIDVIKSFQSFLPSSLDKALGERLVDGWLARLSGNPSLHDKIEFKVAITCFDFTLDKKLTHLESLGFSNCEIAAIREAYTDHAKKLFSGDEPEITSLTEAISLVAGLERYLREATERQVGIQELLAIVRQYGTEPFAMLARYAFVAQSLMNSLSELGAISRQETKEFFSCLNTIAREFSIDVAKLKQGSFAWDNFVSKYGHLRPGTYDIRSPSYRSWDKRHFLGLAIDEEPIGKFSLSASSATAVNKLLREHDLPFEDAVELLAFIRTAIEWRERAKFEFTKGVDLIYEKISGLISDHSLELDDAAFLSIESLEDLEAMSFLNWEASREIISRNKELHDTYTMVRLPPIIKDASNFTVIPFTVESPNFISDLVISGECLVLNDRLPPNEIKGKIVLIEGADPGYDWLFAAGIVGLVTKYGGSNSHMAIRCAEFNIPAAIGCGDSMFNKLTSYSRLTLDCPARIVRGMA